MKTAEPKTASTASRGQTDKPFFSKQGEGNFFGQSEWGRHAFFNPSTHLSAGGENKPPSSLTIGQPGDKYEKEADEMADKVVRSESERISDTSFGASRSVEPPSGQSKCEACEREEEVQKKDEENSTDVESQAAPEKEDKEGREEGKPMVGPGVVPMPLSIVVFSQVLPVMVQSAVPQVQMRANVNLAPPGLPCILFDTTGTPGALDVFFNVNDTALDPTDKTDIENFVGLWVAGGLSDDLLVSGYASTEGPQSLNWRLSCERAEAVGAELATIGVPVGKVTTFAHGETDDFSTTSFDPNRRATITTVAGTGPAITPVITPTDNFAGRSNTRFGLSEGMTVTYNAVPGIAAAEHFGVQWNLVAGSGLLLSFPSFFSPPIPAFYQAGNTPAAEQLALTVVTGPAAGKNLATANLQVVAPLLSYMVQVPGTGLCHTTGTASAGFRGNVFMLPSDVSFNGIQWREGTGIGIGTGSLSGLNGRVHSPTASFLNILNGNAATGCRVNGVDSVSTSTSTPNSSFFGLFTDWTGSFIWPIQWQYRAPGGPIVTYMTAFHICTVNSAGTASQSKAGAGPFTRRLTDPTSCIVGGLPAPHCC